MIGHWSGKTHILFKFTYTKVPKSPKNADYEAKTKNSDLYPSFWDFAPSNDDRGTGCQLLTQKCLNRNEISTFSGFCTSL